MLGMPDGIIGSTSYDSVVLANSSSQVTLSTQFPSSIWQSSTTKLVVVPQYTTIGSTNSSTVALSTGTGMGGQLIIQNYGSIQGAGGLSNSGPGGSAFRADQNLGIELIFENYGTIYSGGGGGGHGGIGGDGYYTTPITVTEGPFYDFNTYYWSQYGSAQNVEWDGVRLINGANRTASSWYDGSKYTYYRGDQTSDNGGTMYKIYRTYASTQTNYTSGGSGGSGGVGQGYAQNLTAGTSGAAGGTNAGSGGAGGLGGNWGVIGQTGSPGTDGNNGTGTVGTGGGAAGYSIINRSYFTLINSGTIVGSTSN